MRSLLLAILLLISARALAVEGHASGLYLGAGLNYGSQILTPETSAASRFTSQGYLVTAGIDIPFSDKSGIQFGAEAGRNSSQNTGNSTGFVEFGQLDHYDATVGFYINHFEFGGGYRYNDVTTKSMTVPAPGYQETDYTGYTPYGYVGLTFDFNSRYRSVIEGQYVTGNLKGSSSTDPLIKYQEMRVALKFEIILN